MRKKTLLEEIARNRRIMGLNEALDMNVYDKILDMYNTYGMKGLSDEEVDYLKSGGETEIPSSFRQERKQRIPAEKFFNEPKGGEDEQEPIS
jgi:hypothetical protein